jgi:hypothetical protein
LSLVVAGLNRAIRRRLDPFELMRHGRGYLSQHGLRGDDDVALEVGVTLATVGGNATLLESLRERLTIREPDELGGGPALPAAETAQSKPHKGPWGREQTARLEVRLSRQEREALSVMAETRGESVSQYVRNAASDRYVIGTAA